MGSTSATPDSATDTVTGAARPLAALDIGTNSFHLVVARPVGRDRFETLTREKEVVRLGHGGGDMKVMTAEAIDRGIACLRRMRRIADSYDATPRAVATSAVREAANAQAFLDRARAEAGIDIEVISGAEEARLIHLGVLQAVPVFDSAPAPRRRRRRIDRAAARPARRDVRLAQLQGRCGAPHRSLLPRRGRHPARRQRLPGVRAGHPQPLPAGRRRPRLRRRRRLVRHGRGDRPRRPRRHGCRTVADVQLLRVHPQELSPARSPSSPATAPRPAEPRWPASSRDGRTSSSPAPSSSKRWRRCSGSSATRSARRRCATACSSTPSAG